MDSPEAETEEGEDLPDGGLQLYTTEDSNDGLAALRSLSSQ